MKVAFIDRDGTIIQDYPDESWKEVEQPIFLEGAISGLKGLNSLGYELIIITNQYLINEGIISLDKFKLINQLVENYINSFGINILKTYYCPHSRQEKCYCRKPNPGMIMDALNDFPSINIEECIIIGDSQCDMQLARNLNVNFYGLAGGDIEEGLLFKNINEVFNYLKEKV